MSGWPTSPLNNARSLVRSWIDSFTAQPLSRYDVAATAYPCAARPFAIAVKPASIADRSSTSPGWSALSRYPWARTTSVPFQPASGTMIL